MTGLNIRTKSDKSTRTGCWTLDGRIWLMHKHRALLRKRYHNFAAFFSYFQQPVNPAKMLSCCFYLGFRWKSFLVQELLQLLSGKCAFFRPSDAVNVTVRSNCRGRVQCLSSRFRAVSFPDQFPGVTVHEKDMAKHEVQSADRTDAHRFFSRYKCQKAIAVLLADILLPNGRSEISVLYHFPLLFG